MNAIVKPIAGPAVASEPGVRAAVTVAYGDGIGPEIMKASLKVLQAAGARLQIEEVAIGESVYLSGNTSGIDAAAWESLRRTRVFYKGPITTPQGGGYKSLNVTVRKSLGLFANVRPCMSIPGYPTPYDNVDLVTIRENTEGEFGWKAALGRVLGSSSAGLVGMRRFPTSIC